MLLDWRMIQILQHTMKGPIPNWYNEVKDKLTNENTFNLKDHWANLPWREQHIQFISYSDNPDRRFKNWYIWRHINNDQIYWGRGKTDVSKSNRTLIHYTPIIDPLTENIILKKCQRCNISSLREKTETCLIPV